MKRSFICWLTLYLLLLAQWPVIANITLPDNPAELAYNNTRFELALPVVSFTGTNNLFDSQNMNADLSDPVAKAKFLDRIDGEGFKANLNSDLTFGLTFGHVEVQVRPWVSGSANLKQGFTDLVFNGYEAGKTYDLNGSKIDGIAALSLDLSYGRIIRDNDRFTSSAGLTFHYLSGLGVGKAKVTANTLTPDSWGQADYQITTDSIYGSSDDSGFSGQGFLIDFGYVYKNANWNAGVVLKNIGPAIKWKGLTRKNSVYSGSIIGGADGPELPEPDAVETETSNEKLSTTIPLVLELYGGRQLGDRLRWNFGVTKGASDAYGISTAPLLWTGLEWQPWQPFTLTGNMFWIDSQLGIDTTLRLKARFFDFNFNIGWTGGINPDEATALTGSLRTALHF